MLDQKDLTFIEQSVEKVVDRSLEKFAHETLNKSFQGVQSQIDEVKEGVKDVKERVGQLDATLHNQYPNKEYLDNKLADAVSEIGKILLKREEREKTFKLRLLNLLEKYPSAPLDEIAQLRELV